MPTDPQQALDLGAEGGHARRLNIEDVVEVARGLKAVAPLHATPHTRRAFESAMQAGADWIDGIVSAGVNGQAVYGINTGFGALSGRSALRERFQAQALMRGLVTSHAAGVGEDLPEEVVRAAILIRSRQLAGGLSGIRILVVNRLLGLLNHRILPAIPRMGSLGASGDLAPLAHLALAISVAPDEPPRTSGENDPAIQLDRHQPELWTLDDATEASGAPQRADRFTPGAPRWRRSSQDQALAALGGPVVLEAKEGLSLTNGATFSAALAALAVADSERLLAHAELAVAMVLEAIGGFRDPFLPEVVGARPYPGALRAAAAVLAYIRGSGRLDAADRDRDPAAIPPQDFYSLRCAPQVLGAGWDATDFARRMVEVEINSAVDNPLILLDLPRDYKAASGGNFHGAPLGYALDLLKVAAADCASMSERRTFKLTDYRRLGSGANGAADGALPTFLVHAPAGLEGIYSGLMIAQYTAASLVSAAKTLSHPDSVDSIPSSAGQEDHVSMSMNAGLHARTVLEHAEAVVAIELLVAAQAMDLSGRGRPAGAGTQAARDRLREVVPFLDHDRVLSGDIAAVRELMRGDVLLAAARRAAGMDMDHLRRF